LDYPEYEVVVVDNASRDPAVAEVVAQSGCRYVREDGPGLNWARNRGIEEANHDLIAFIDDDALAASGWLRGHCPWLSRTQRSWL
jgi:glycosyltransferase involved in cell wall biosynthesis